MEKFLSSYCAVVPSIIVCVLHCRFYFIFYLFLLDGVCFFPKNSKIIVATLSLSKLSEVLVDTY